MLTNQNQHDQTTTKDCIYNTKKLLGQTIEQVRWVKLKLKDCLAFTFKGTVKRIISKHDIAT